MARQHDGSALGGEQLGRNHIVRTGPAEALGDRFRATRVLKAGPSGETLRGVDTADGGQVVIRTMAGPDPSASVRLEQEMAVLARLAGTGLAHPLAAGRQGAVLYSILPCVPGVTLESRLGAGNGPLTVTDALAVGRGVLQGLARAHEQGFLHRECGRRTWSWPPRVAGSSGRR